MKSESKFAFHIDGDNSIDAVVLSQIISGLAELTKFAAKEEDPEAYLKMNVTAFKNGSFEIDFSTICEIEDNLINIVQKGIPLAATLVGTVKGFLEIKKLIKGNNAKDVKELPNNKIKVTSENNESIVVNKSSVAILNNPSIDQVVVNISNNIYGHNPSGGFTFKSENGNTDFNNDDLINLGKPIPYSNAITYKEQTVKIDLPIKKADVLGNSAWSFIYDKKAIVASIEDYDFLKKVHIGDISLHAGDYITALLKIVYEIDENNLPIENTTKYTVVKVIGDIQNNKKFTLMQMKFD